MKTDQYEQHRAAAQDKLDECKAEFREAVKAVTSEELLVVMRKLGEAGDFQLSLLLAAQLPERIRAPLAMALMNALGDEMQQRAVAMREGGGDVNQT